MKKLLIAPLFLPVQAGSAMSLPASSASSTSSEAILKRF
jgi:hypothetical protein